LRALRRVGARLMLVVVHQDESIGVGREERHVEVGIFNGHVDIEAEIAGVEVVVKSLDELLEAGLSGGGNVLEVQREAAVACIGGEEGVDLVDEVGARGRVQEHLADGVFEDAVGGGVVVDEREDFGVFVSGVDGLGDLVFAIDTVDDVAFDDREGDVGGVDGRQGAVGLDDVKPFGEEEIDLLDVLLEGGVAGGVGVGIESRAETFALVQDDVGGLEIGFAMGRLVEFFLRGELVGGRVRKSAIALGGGTQVEAVHGLDAHEADDKDGTYDDAEDGERVKETPEPLPALALRIEKNLFAHS